MATKKKLSKNKKQAAKRARPRGRRPGTFSFKDVQIAYLTDGVSGLESALLKGTSRHVFRTALDAFKAAGGRSVETFERWMTEHFGAAQMGRGRSKPLIGGKRDYKVQQLGEGEPFLRLPLSLLGLHKGEAVTVSFERDFIRVSKSNQASRQRVG